MAGHGLTFRAVDLQNADTPGEAEIWFDIQNRFEPAEVRGDDLIIPQKHGRTYMDRYQDRYVADLRGFVRGLGNTEVERQQAWRAATTALLAVMDLTLGPGTLSIVAPYQGLAAGSESIQAFCVNAVPGPVLNRESFQRWSFQLQAIGDPPEWA
jgi:hypothetical protein